MMLFPRLLPIAVIALFSVAAIAQEAPAPVPAPAEAAQAMPHGCGSQALRHDHGAERGTAASRTTACPMAAPAASATSAKRKVKPIHDHSKVHKLM